MEPQASVFALKNLVNEAPEYWNSHDLSFEKRGDTSILVVTEKAGGLGQGLMKSPQKEKVSQEVLKRMENYIKSLESGTVDKTHLNTVDAHVRYIISKLTGKASGNPSMQQYQDLKARLNKLRLEG